MLVFVFLQLSQRTAKQQHVTSKTTFPAAQQLVCQLDLSLQMSKVNQVNQIYSQVVNATLTSLLLDNGLNTGSHQTSLGYEI